MIEEKKKRKKWFSIPASKEFREIEIGEVPANSVEDLLNKNLSVPLSMITNDFKKQGILITFRVTEIKDNKPVTEIKKIEYSCVNDGTSCVEDENEIGKCVLPDYSLMQCNETFDFGLDYYNWGKINYTTEFGITKKDSDYFRVPKVIEK